MKKRFIVKSVTKFVVFDNLKRSIVKGEYLSIQNADAHARTMNLDARSIEVFAKADEERTRTQQEPSFCSCSEDGHSCSGDAPSRDDIIEALIDGAVEWKSNVTAGNREQTQADHILALLACTLSSPAS